MWSGRHPRDAVAATNRIRTLYTNSNARLAGEERLRVFNLTRTFSGTTETIYADSVHFAGERGYQMLLAELERQGLLEQIRRRYRAWEGIWDNPPQP